MLDTKSFYGFTKNLKPLNRGRVEKMLNECEAYRILTDDKDDKTVDFIVAGRKADALVELIFNKGYNRTKTELITHGMINGQ